MGTALAATVVAILVTAWGCLSLTSSEGLLRVTAWAIYHNRYLPDGGDKEIGQVLHLGLVNFVLETCSDAPGRDYQKWGGCVAEVVPWVQAGCSDGDAHYLGYPCKEVNLPSQTLPF